jgi:hypothetical protein
LGVVVSPGQRRDYDRVIALHAARATAFFSFLFFLFGFVSPCEQRK